MQYSSGLPAWFVAAFANAGDKNTIPATTTVTGAAALNTGWPSICSLPEEAGGIAITREDLNGILYWLSHSIQRLQAGGFMPYDAAFAAAIGGYPKGALVRKADGTGYWMNEADSNTTDPDGGSSANWTDAGIAAGDAVLLTGNQTVSGIKTFSSSPVVPDATAAHQPVALGQFPSSLGTSGWKKYPDPNSPSGYFIEQWAKGTEDPATSAEPSQTITFPATFPNACVSISVGCQLTVATASADSWYNHLAPGLSSVVVQRQNVTTAGQYSGSTTRPVVWAKGY